MRWWVRAATPIEWVGLIPSGSNLTGSGSRGHQKQGLELEDKGVKGKTISQGTNLRESGITT